MNARPPAAPAVSRPFAASSFRRFRFTLRRGAAFAAVLAATLAGPTPARAAGPDADGDGQSDADETTAGTNPLDAQSVFKVTAVQALSPTTVRLTWTSVAGRTYRPQQLSGNLGQAGATWNDLATVPATAATTTYDATIGAGTTRAFFRVVVDAPAAGLGAVTATPASPLTRAGGVVLSVVATHPTGVAFVNFFDGATLLGRGVPATGGAWNFYWAADVDDNGTRQFSAQAQTGGGLALNSPALPYVVNIPTDRPRATNGVLDVFADTLTPTATGFTAQGDVRIGRGTFVTGDAVTGHAAAGTITGTGGVVLPLLGNVLNGAWTIDTATGWLKPGAGATWPTPFTFAPGATMTFTALQVDLANGDLAGEGALTLALPGGGPTPLTASGVFLYDAATNTLALDGAFVLGGVSGTGHLVVNLADGTFSFGGAVATPAGAGGAAQTFANATLTGGGGALLQLTGQRSTGGGNFVGALGLLAGDGSFQPSGALPAQPDYLLQNPDQFVRLGTNGEPLEGALVYADAAGNLPPCEFRPAGRGATGLARGLWLRFPAGARIVAGPALEFSRAQAGFGADFPLQLPAPLERSTSTLTTLPLGPVSAAQLAAIFGFNAADGVAVKAFGVFPLRWLGGAVGPNGFRGFSFDLSQLGLPLPARTGGGVAVDVRFDDVASLSLPVWGSFALPDGTGSPAQLAVNAANPLWLTLGADRRVKLAGRADLAFPGGAALRVDVNIDSPTYALQFVASGVNVPVISDLGGALPSNFALGAAVPNTGPALDTEAARLDAQAQVFALYATSLLGETTAPGVPAVAPEPLEGLAAALKAYAFAKVADGGVVPGSDQIRRLYAQLGESATAAPTLAATLKFRAALARAKQAALADTTSAEFTAALNAALAAALARAKADDGSSLAGVEEALHACVEAETLLQASGATITDVPLRNAMQALLDRFLFAQAARLGVRAGEYDLAQNGTVRGLSRFVVYEELAHHVAALRDAQSLGLDLNVPAPRAELLVQLATRLHVALAEALDAAQRGADYPAFLYALEDYLELWSWEQTGLLPAHAARPPLLDPGSFAARLQVVFDADAARPIGTRPAFQQLAEARRLNRILRTVPGNVTWPAASIQRAYDRMETAIAQVLPVFSSAQVTYEDALAVLEGGVRNAELRDRFAFAQTTPWEDATRLPAIVDHAVTKGAAAQDWSGLLRGFRLCLDEAQRQGAAGNQPRRRLYLEQAAKFLPAVRTVALALSAQNPVLRAVDLALPGDIHVDRVAGAATFDAAKRSFRGAFSGQLRLPKWALTLTLDGATLTSGGAFEIGAHGTIVLPSAAAPKLRFTVPARRPLRLKFEPGSYPQLAGGGRVEVNGMSFEGWLRLADPEYGFGIAASGLNFDLADQARVMIPTLPNTGVFTDAVNADLREYFRSLGATFETLSTFAPPEMREAGAPPAALTEMETTPADALQAWANNKLADAALNVNRDYAATFGHTIQQLDALTGRLQKQQATLWQRKTIAELRTLAAVRRAIVQHRAEHPGEPTAGLAAAERRLRDTAPAVLIALLQTNPALTPDEQTDLGQVVVFVQDELKQGGPEDLAAEGQLATALDQYYEGNAGAFYDAFGLDPATGEPKADRTRYDAVTREEALAAFEALALRVQAEMKTGGDPAKVAKLGRAQLWLEIRFRKLAIERLKKTSPEDFEAYGEINRATNDMIRLEMISQNWGTDYGTTPIPQLDGADAPRGVDDFSRNATARFLAAATYASPGHPGWDRLTKSGGEKIRREIRAKVVDPGTNTVTERTVAYYSPLQELNGDFEYARPKTWFGKRVLWPGPAPRPEFTQTQLVYQQFLAHGLGASELNGTGELGRMYEKLRVELAQFYGEPALDRGLHVLGELLRVARAAQTAGDPAMLASLRLDLSLLSDGFRALAQTKKAWWYLAEYTDILTEHAALTVGGAAFALRDACLDSTAATLRTARALAADLALLLPGQRPFDLTLPGDLRVARVFGELTFNRQTEIFTGSFGGRVEFPQHDAYFEIVNATISNDGTLAISAGLGTPLPLGGVKVRATASFAGGGFPNPIAGQLPLNATISLSGSGTIILPDAREFGATLAYSTATGVLDFNGTTPTFDLSRHFVVLNGNYGFSLGGLDPQGVRLRTGELRLGGSFGLARRSDPAGGAFPTAANFHLVAENAQSRLLVSPTQIVAELASGTLRLPELFTTALCANPTAPGPRPPATIAIPAADPIQLVFDLTPTGPGGLPEISRLTLDGALVASNIGFAVPDFPELAGAVCSGSLDFPTIVIQNQLATVTELPVLTIASGKLSLPVPPPQPPALVNLTNVVWRMDGLPSGEISLANNVVLFDQGGFTVSALGGQSCGPGQPATGVRVHPAAAGALPKLEFFGGMKFEAAESTLTREPGTGTPPAPGDAPNRVSALACGSATVAPDALPTFSLDTLALGGTFRLGSGGVTIANASLSLEGIGNLFNQSEAAPFLVRLGGTILVPNGPGFGLQNCRFVFFDNAELPRFEPGTLLYTAHQWDLVNNGYLPLNVTAASLTFIVGSRPLPELFAPTNLKIGVSATLALPNAASPVFSGTVNDLQVTFAADGTPIFSVDGLGMSLDPGFKIPPLEELGGQVYLGGLNRPEDLFFTGRLAGSYQGYKLKVLFAMNTRGPIGACLDVNAGSVGIPLGTTGFLISGASGGISFANNAGDPCAFATYVDPVTGKPKSLATPPAAPIDWNQLKAFTEKFQKSLAATGARPASGVPAPVNTPESPAAASATAAKDTASSAAAAKVDPPPSFPCPGDCPPPSVNIFCQPHPDQAQFPGRIIAKFSCIDEPTLNSTFGLTRDSIAQLIAGGGNLAQQLAAQLVQKIGEITPDPAPGPALELYVQVLGELQLGFEGMFQTVLSPPGAAADVVYPIVRDNAYKGLPCLDVTMVGSGTATHSAVSSFLSVTGQATLSTAGAAGVSGTVNLVGLPVGVGKLFVSATDANGLPNPAACGEVLVRMGPIDFAWLKASARCDGCVSAILGLVPQLVGTLAQPLFDDLVAKAVPHRAGASKTVFLSTATNEEKIAFLAALFAESPARLSAEAPTLVNTFLTASDAAGVVVDRLNPEILLCGSVTPKLFGLPVTGELVGVSARVTKDAEQAGLRFSPTAIIGAYSPFFVPFFSGADTASLGYSGTFADPKAALAAGLRGQLSSPAQVRAFAEQQFSSILQGTNITVAYDFFPFGMKIASAQARVIMPDLVNHPVLRSPAWTRPDDRGGLWPSRLALLDRATRAGLLGNTLWKGDAADLYKAYDSGSPEYAFLQSQNASFAKDYFPHGGLVGAAYLQMPRALTDAPPAYLAEVLNAGKAPLQRVQAAVQYVDEYVLTLKDQGMLGFYVPAPNPPALFNADGTPLVPAPSLTPLTLLESIQSFDVAKIRTGQFYPGGETLLRGRLDGTLWGVPLVNAVLDGTPPSQTEPARFRGLAQIPAGSALRDWIGAVNLEVDFRNAPADPIEENFALLRADLQAAIDSGAKDAELLALLTRTADELGSRMPRGMIKAEAIGLAIPPAFAQMLGFSGAATGSFQAYTPKYDPAATGPGALAVAKRDGGVVLAGNFRFANLFDLSNAELTVTGADSAAPRFAGNFNLATAALPGPLSLDTIAFSFDSGAPVNSPFLSASAQANVISLGYFDVRPKAPATKLAAAISASLDAGGQRLVSLSLSPARLTLPMIDGANLVSLDGGAATTPFTFSNDPAVAWSARATFQNEIRVRAGSTDVLRYAGTGVSGTLAGQGLQSGSVTVALNSGVDLEILPGHALARTLRTQGTTGTMTLRSDGTFTVSGTVGQGFSHTTSTGAWPVTVPVGATFTLNNTSATFAFTANGAAASLTIDYTVPAAPTVAYSGKLAFGPYTTGVFTVDGGTDGAALAVTIANGTGTVAGARFKAGAPFNWTVNLPSGTFTSSGNFTLNVPATALTLGGFALNNSAFTVARSGSTISVSNFTATLPTPAIGLTTNVGGSVGSGGTYTLTGTTTLAGAFTNLPVGSFSAGTTTTITFSSATGLTASGTVTGGLLGTGVFPGVTTAAGCTLTVGTGAVTALTGSLSVPVADFGELELKPASGNFTASFSTAGLALPASLDLYFTGSSTTTKLCTLPAVGFTLPNLGAALPATLLNVSTPTTGTFAGFGLGSVTFRLERYQDSPARYRLANFAANVTIPGFSGLPAFTAQTLDGAVTTASLTLGTFPALTNGRFTFGFSGTQPTFTTGGVLVPVPTLSCTGLFTGLTIPGGALTIPSTGSFTRTGFAPGNLAPTAALGALNGFTLTGPSFGVNKSGATMTLTNFTAGLAVPGFTANSVPLSLASLPASGDFEFTGSIASLTSDVFNCAPTGGVRYGTAAGLRLLSTMLTCYEVFGSGLGLGDLTIPTGGWFNHTFTATPVVHGFNLGSSSMTFARSSVTGTTTFLFNSTAYVIPGTSGALNLTGRVSSLGALDLELVTTSGSFAGFPVGSLTLALYSNLGSYQSLVTGDAPAHYWRMESLSGATVPATVGNAGTVTGAVTAGAAGALYTPGATNLAYTFPGGTDSVTVNTSTALHFSSALSVEAWVRVNAWDATWQAIVTKGDNAWRVHRYGNTSRVAFGTNHAGGANDLVGNTDLVPGQWYHLVATYDGRTKCLYVNGVLDASAEESRAIDTNTYAVQIGGNAQAAGREFNGRIDEVALYGSALTALQVAEHYQSGAAATMIAAFRSQAPGLTTATFGGAVTSAGRVDLYARGLSPTLLGFPFASTDLGFTRTSGSASITGRATLGALPVPAGGIAAPFVTAPRFNATITAANSGPPLFLTSYQGSFVASAQALKVLGFNFSGVNFTLNGTLGGAQPKIQVTGAGLSDAWATALGFPAFQGQVFADGFVDLAPATTLSSFTLGGFPSTLPNFSVNSYDGLWIYGRYAVDVTPPGGTRRNFGSIDFYGTFSTSGSYQLYGDASLTLGGYALDSIQWRLESGAIKPMAAVNLNFGNLDVAVSPCEFTATSAVVGMNAAIGTRDWQTRVSDGIGNKLLEDKFNWSVNFSFNVNGGATGGSGSLSAGMSTSASWSWRAFGSIPVGQPASGSFSVSGGIGSNGQFQVNASTTGVSGFKVPPWGLSTPGWALSAFDFTLWP